MRVKPTNGSEGESCGASTSSQPPNELRSVNLTAAIPALKPSGWRARTSWPKATEIRRERASRPGRGNTHYARTRARAGENRRRPIRPMRYGLLPRLPLMQACGGIERRGCPSLLASDPASVPYAPSVLSASAWTTSRHQERSGRQPADWVRKGSAGDIPS